MAIDFYDENQVSISSSAIRDSFNATVGSIVERKLHIRNDDTSLYYTNISVSV